MYEIHIFALRWRNEYEILAAKNTTELVDEIRPERNFQARFYVLIT